MINEEMPTGVIATFCKIASIELLDEPLTKIRIKARFYLDETTFRAKKRFLEEKFFNIEIDPNISTSLTDLLTQLETVLFNQPDFAGRKK